MVYDTRRGIWQREDDPGIRIMAGCMDDLYAYTDTGLVSVYGHRIQKDASGEKLQWYAETGMIGASTPDAKYLARISIRMAMGSGSRVKISVQYDNAPYWEPLWQYACPNLRGFTLPVKTRRCGTLRLRLEGEGDVTIYSITKTMETGSDIP